MTAALLIFVAQFSMVMLLGIQSLNVRDRNYVGSALTSLLLGVSSYHITATIATLKGEAVGGLLWWCYIAAGPLGIVTSIWLPPKLNRLLKNKDKNNG